jgi:hypothetical protein
MIDVNIKKLEKSETVTYTLQEVIKTPGVYQTGEDSMVYLISFPQNGDKVNSCILWYNKITRQLVAASHISYQDSKFIKLDAKVELNLYL